MHHFEYRGNILHAEDVPVTEIAREVGTPFYLYSHATLKHHFEVFDNSFEKIPHITCFSMKSNSNIAILKLFARLGGGADIVSGGELYRAICAGVPRNRIVYSGVGKTEEEICFALEEDILMFNVESEEELEVINECAGRLEKKARIALRVNPDVDPKTHPYISTGLEKNKFGLDVKSSIDNYKKAQNLENIEVTGIDCHIGSQLTELSPFVGALARLKTLIGKLKEMGISIKYLDLGGGLGITYNDETPPHPIQYAREIIKMVQDLGCTLILEPGRVIVGNAGILVTKVLYTKSTSIKKFLIVDAGMNDLVRPSLYGSYHHIQPVILKKEAEKETVDVVGPICESGDFLAQDRELPVCTGGDYLAVMSAGAYGFTMASNYNSRLRPAEVMVKEDKFFVIRERETYEDLVAKERIPEFLEH